MSDPLDGAKSTPEMREGRMSRLRKTNRGRTVVLGAVAAGTLLACALPAAPAFAATATVGLGTVGAYSVLGGQAVTNTGPSILNANVGVNRSRSMNNRPGFRPVRRPRRKA
jgi:hypothetical protein